MTAAAPRLVNALSVDVEDWFQVENYGAAVPRAHWGVLEPRVAASTHRLLDVFAEAGAKATFFTLGWVAERNRELIRRIVADGHELASHGQDHERVAAIGPERFAADLRRAKAVLEDIGGVAVAGYRAPTFSIGPRSTPWAHDILAETGHRYSSSVFPGRHEGAAAADLPLVPFRPSPSGVPEIPMTALRHGALGARAIPVSGGGWFRMMPYPAF
ncbi:MAG: polysaccharide deacetylase family protein, partial [Acetobacteraceae bacterium]|nr:polysaccharide deacetylase family protein [Acetobacteraceae bacterium]